MAWFRAYEYLQNDAMNARSLLQPEPLPNTLRQNQFGATLGGPIRKNRTFLFGNYEAQRRSESPFLPPDFRSNLAALNQAKAYLGLAPENVDVLKTKDNDYGFVRVDHQLTANNRNFLAVRYNVEHTRALNQLVGNTEDGGGIGTPSGGRNLFITDQAVVGTLNSSLTDKFVNTLLVQFARRHYDFPGTTGEPNLDIPNDLSVGHNFGTLDAIHESRLQLSGHRGMGQRESLCEIRIRFEFPLGFHELSRVHAGADHPAQPQLPGRFRQLRERQEWAAAGTDGRLALSAPSVPVPWRRRHVLRRRAAQNQLCGWPVS